MSYATGSGAIVHWHELYEEHKRIELSQPLRTTNSKLFVALKYMCMVCVVCVVSVVCVVCVVCVCA